MPKDVLATDHDVDNLESQSIETVKQLIKAADKVRTRHDNSNRDRFSRLLKDPQAVALTMSLTDEVMRISFKIQASRIMRKSARLATAKGLGLVDFVGIKAASLASLFLPRAVMAVVHLRIRRAANGIILPAEQSDLRKHINLRSGVGMRLNINLLGEAVLGHEEAQTRLNAIIELVKRPEVSYISVKISSIVSQMISIDHEGSVHRAAESLRILYRQAQLHKVFINLDMEEFRDLGITVDTFKLLLNEAEFETMNAGIVLQAYLPESHQVFADLAIWAKERHERAGGSIKIRIVKGANLAMEKAEAEIHGWVPAPYSTKADVDASYTRLIDVALRPHYAKALRVGIASHNLFHIAWAIDVARSRGVVASLDIEMLEGMANAEALAVSSFTGSVLLYTPVARHQDFPAAVAYLVRRLDENTSKENYLRSSFDMAIDNQSFKEQQERFINSIAQRHSISTHSRRHNERRHNVSESFNEGVFLNESDADPTNSYQVGLLRDAMNSVYRLSDLSIPLVINGKEIFTAQTEEGIDPSDEGSVWYRYSIASFADVDSTIAGATAAFESWSMTHVRERVEILGKAASIMESERFETIAVMSRDAGKVFAEADPEVTEAIDFARFYALSALTKEMDSKALGVVLIVPPWNFPYAIVMGGVCAGLAAGNTVVLKPAPETVATAWRIVNQLWAAGIPKDVLQFLPSRDDEVGKYLVTHESISAVILTGSFDTALMFSSWRPEINLMAETSGKNAILISASADIDNAVKDLVQSAFGHAGQKCSAASLAIVHTSVYRNAAFQNQLKDAVESLRIGAGRDFATSVGPIIHPPTGPLLRALNELDEGEGWLVAPNQLDTPGYLWSPGVKIGLSPTSWSVDDEWFGPVLGVIEATDFDAALAIANKSQFGLTAGLHSLDVEECEKWIENMQAGNLYVNRGITGAVVNRQPFGGWKRSSVGLTAKAGGVNYLSNLRQWAPMKNLADSQISSENWWKSVGSQAIDTGGLHVERNYQRYRRFSQDIVVCIDDDGEPAVREYILWLSTLLDIGVRWRPPESQINQTQKVRWLSKLNPPLHDFMVAGIAIDQRPIAARGDIEVPRWLQEQSVSILNHRYGNVGAGPHPTIA